MMIEQRAFARAGLLGNPSDGYFGKTISLIIRNFGAHVSLFESPELHIRLQEEDRDVFRSMDHLVDSVGRKGYYGGARLVKAAVKKFHDYCTENGLEVPERNFTFEYHSSIPRQVGLAGSSAIITATLRALMEFYDIEIPIEEQPALVLSAEVDELGITAGLQDRVIQVYEGCVYMDFSREILTGSGYGRYEPLDPSLLPHLYVAYRTEPEKVSGRVLNTLRIRYDEGDEQVISTLDAIAQLAEKGREALLNRDVDHLNQLINTNFELRSEIMQISDKSREMVTIARDCGASAKLTGSGGAVIGVYSGDDMLERIIDGMKGTGARVLKPQIV